MIDKGQVSASAKKTLELLRNEKLQFLTFMKSNVPVWEMSAFKNSNEDKLLAEILTGSEFRKFLEAQLKSKIIIQESLF